jgi:hypothetical protein
MFLLFHYCCSSPNDLLMSLLFHCCCFSIGDLFYVFIVPLLLFLSWYPHDVLVVHCSSLTTITIPLDLLVHPKHFLLFFVILLFIFSNCSCSSWSPTVIAPLPDDLVHPQQILFLILFFIFSLTPITFCPLVLSHWALDPPPTLLTSIMCLRLL